LKTINTKYISALSIIISLSLTSNVFAALTDKEQLGKNLFFDKNLSEPAGQSCASCHDPKFGFADPDFKLPVSEGVIAGRFGGRNTPSAAYSAFSPNFSLTMMEPRGGQFWDGRAANLIEQAKGPFLSSVEMNNPDKASVVVDVQASTYATLFERVYGANAFADINLAYDNIADAIASYESTSEVNPFSSKFDAVQAGNAKFTAEEQQGFQLFSGKAQCSTCHTVGNGIDNNNTTAVVFSNFTYHNIGIPKNTEYPLDQQAVDSVDNGLGAALNDAAYNGLFKTSHLRNIEKTAPYMHNGFLKTLKEVVHFYNTRDVLGLWPAPEASTNLNTQLVGNLGLTDAEEDSIVAFLNTLTD